MHNKYPLDLFNNKGIRCSDFYIEGTIKEKITTNMIKAQLVNPLIKEKKIHYDYAIMEEFHRITEKVIKKYNTTNHEPVLTHLLMEMKRINLMSMETPVWHKKITGHIDLLGELNDRLVIIEYKPKEAELYKGMIQACIYAYILSKMLKMDMKKINCLIFTPKMGLSFESTILNDIIEFIQIQNSKRERRLTLKNNKPYDIEIELLKLINN
jgi:predicted RecB family nuclease